MHYSLYPEVAGGFGDNVIYDPETQHVEHLHYEFDGWLGDDILQTSPCCYIVSERLKQAIGEVAMTGFAFADVEISTSEQFQELYADREIPEFSWLKICGRAGVDDFGISSDNCLVVSERALKAMQDVANLENCDITEYQPN